MKSVCETKANMKSDEPQKDYDVMIVDATLRLRADVNTASHAGTF